MFAETLAVVRSISSSTQTAQSKNAASEPDVTRSQRVSVDSRAITLPNSTARAAHAAHRTSANRAFAQTTGDKSRLVKVACIFHSELIVQVHRFLADGAWRQLDVPQQEVVRSRRSKVARVVAQLGRCFDQTDGHGLAHARGSGRLQSMSVGRMAS